jgi:hypothetical protein
VIPAALLNPRVFLAAGLAAAVFYVGWTVRDHSADSDIKDLKASHVLAVNAAAEKLRKAETDAKAREDALIDKTKGIVDEARTIVAGLETELGRADAASRGLLDAGRRAANRCTANSNPSPAGGGAGTSVSGGMSDGDRFLRVLGELDGFAGAAAEDSGRARAARDVCQRFYEAAMKEINR